MKMKEKEFFVIRGILSQNEKICISTLDLIPYTKPPYNTQDILREVRATGKEEDGKILFSRYAYELKDSSPLPKGFIRPRRFVLPIENYPKLCQIDIFYNGKVVKTYDKSKKPEIEIETKTSKQKQLILNIQGKYDRLKIIARSPKTDEYTHIHLDDTPNEGSKRTIEIQWETLPASESVVLEAVAIQGISVEKIFTEKITVEIQPTKLFLYRVGFRETKIKGEKDATYHFVFAAKGYHHGQPINPSNYHWEILRKSYTGRNIPIKRKGKRKFKVKVTVTDPLGKKCSTEMIVDPTKIVNTKNQTKKLEKSR